MRIRSTRLPRQVLAATLVLALAAGCSSSSEADQPDADGLTKVSVGATAPSLSYGVLLAMLALDLDAKHGLEVEYNATGTSSTVVMSGLLSGEFDFAQAASSTALDAISQGAPAQILAATFKHGSTMVMRKEQTAELAPITPKSSIGERVAALKGLTIATTPPGSGTNLLLRSIIEDYGMDPDKDMKIIGVSEPSAMIAGIDQGKFDAAIFGTGSIEQTIADGSADLWFTVGVDDTKGISDLRGLSLISTTKYAESNGDVVEAFRDALAEAGDAIRKDPDGVGAKIKAEFFPDFKDELWNVAWPNVIGAYPTDVSFPKSSFDGFEKLAPKKYGVSYDDAVYPAARG